MTAATVSGSSGASATWEEVTPEIENAPPSYRLFENSAFRQGLMRYIQAHPGSGSGRPLRAILAKELADRRAGITIEHRDSLHWCSYLLSLRGELEDVQALWEARNVDEDTAKEFDVQCLVGAGVAETVEYLRASPLPWARAALRCIEAGLRVGAFDDLEQWRAWKDVYFSTR